MSLRFATIADLPALVTLVARIVPELPKTDTFVGQPVDQVAQSLRWLLSSDDTTIVITEDASTLTGFLGFVAFVHPLSGIATASRVCGGGDTTDLVPFAEAWAKGRGCTKMILTAPLEPSSVRSGYEALGYCVVDLPYQKELSA